MTDGRKDMTQLIEFAILRTYLKISCVKYEYETTLEQLLPLPGNEPRMSFPIVISIVNDVHSAAHKQSSTQNYVQDKIKILPKSSFSVFSALLSRHTQKNKFLLFGYQSRISPGLVPSKHVLKVLFGKVAKQISFNRTVIFCTGGSFLRKLLKVHSSCMCAGFILYRQRLKLNWSENVPAYTGYITMHSNSFSCFRSETTDGRTHGQTKLSIMCLIYFVCVHRHHNKLT